MIQAYLFDLDGTLLPLDEEKFIDLYIKAIGQKFHQLGYDAEDKVRKLWAGTKAMVMNQGDKLNIDVFWEIFHPDIESRQALESKLVDFYNHEFQAVRKSVEHSIYAKKIIDLLKSKSKDIYLLTNPIFPFVATKHRIEWAGLNPSDFKHITTYENSYFAKPNHKYYQSIIDTFNLSVDETMMVGNDMDEDMIASKLGLDTYLVTDCLKNKSETSIDAFKHGSLKAFYQYLLKQD